MPRHPETNTQTPIKTEGGFGGQEHTKNLIHFGPEELAAAAGLNHCWKTEQDLITAVAIAMAESSGNTNAENHNTNGTIDRGLWQVNSVHGFTGNLFDPAYNVLAACSVYKSQGFNAWSTYKNGAYKQFLPQAEKGVKQWKGSGATENVEGGLGAVIPGVSEVGSWLGDLGKILSFLLSSSGWLRIGKVLIGSILLIIALDQLSKLAGGPSAPVADTIKAVAK